MVYNAHQPIGTMTAVEFLNALEAAGYKLTPIAEKSEENSSKSFLTGVKELAAFLNMSVSSAQRKISNGDFDFCLYRTGQIILIDKEKLLEGLRADKPLVRKYRKRN